jgi:hypothetical protein
MLSSQSSFAGNFKKYSIKSMHGSLKKLTTLQGILRNKTKSMQEFLIRSLDVNLNLGNNIIKILVSVSDQNLDGFQFR